MTPVLERWSGDCPFWAVEQREFLLTVPRLPTPERVGAIVWALIGRNVTDDDLSITVADAAEAIEAYLTSDDEPYAPGGLRVTADDVVIDSGCCVGLDEWRDWLNVVGGQVIDLGHDPDVLLEHHGPVLRLWQDKDQILPQELPGPSERYIEIPRDVLPPFSRAFSRTSPASCSHCGSGHRTSFPAWPISWFSRWTDACRSVLPSTPEARSAFAISATDLRKGVQDRPQYVPRSLTYGYIWRHSAACDR